MLQLLHLLSRVNEGSPKDGADIVVLVDGRQHPILDLEFRQDPTARFNLSRLQLALFAGPGKSDEKFVDSQGIGAPVVLAEPARVQSKGELIDEIVELRKTVGILTEGNKNLNAMIEQLHADYGKKIAAAAGAPSASIPTSSPTDNSGSVDSGETIRKEVDMRPDALTPGTQETAPVEAEQPPPAAEPTSPGEDSGPHGGN